MCKVKGEVFIVEVVCNQSSIMADEKPSSSSIRVFMTEEEALWYEFAHVDSQLGSSSKGNMLATVLTREDVF